MNHALIVLAIFLIIFNAAGVYNAYYENRRMRDSRRKIESKVSDEDVLFFRELNRPEKSSGLVFKNPSPYAGLAELAEIVAESGTPLHPKGPTIDAPKDK